MFSIQETLRIVAVRCQRVGGTNFIPYVREEPCQGSAYRSSNRHRLILPAIIMEKINRLKQTKKVVGRHRVF